MNARIAFFACCCVSAWGQTHFFHDDFDGRAVGVVEALRSELPEGAALALRIRAAHPLVDPELGWRPVRGMNRNTAFQLEALAAREGRLAVVAKDPAGRVVTEGRLVDVARGDHIERTRRPDGRFAYGQVVERNVVHSLDLRGGALAAGTYEAEIWAYGERRMALRLRVEERELRVLEVQSLPHGERDPSRGRFPDDQWLITDAPEDGEAPAIELPVPEADWAGMTLDQKWAAYENDVAEAVERRAGWARFLVRARDFEFLEQLGIHDRGAFETLNIGLTLKQEGSDRWIRLAAWHHKNTSGHGPSVTYAMLTDTNTADQVLAWLDQHPEEAARPILSNVVADLREAKIEPAADLRALPPLDPAQVFRAWADPASKATAAEFERGLMAFVTRGQFHATYMQRLAELRDKEPDPARRQSALLAYSFMPSTHVPLERLEEIADDGREDDRIREAAVLATRRVDRAEAFVLWHDWASRPDHPGWAAATSYLGDMGNAYTLRVLGGLGDLKPDQQQVRGSSVAAIQAREDKKNGDPNVRAQTRESFRMIDALLAAERRGSATAASLRPWFLARERPNKGTERAEALVDGLEKRAAKAEAPDAEVLRDLLRDLKGP